MKKVILWSIYLGFVAILVFGAVNRTTAKSGGSVREQQLLSEDRNNKEIYSDFGERNGSGREKASPDSDPREPAGEVEGDHDLSVEDDHNWLELRGVVAGVDDFAIAVEIGNEEIVEISRRAYRYAVELGYSPAAGDEVLLTGFFEGGEFEVGSILDENSGDVWVIRDKTGRPMWAGNGS